MHKPSAALRTLVCTLFIAGITAVGAQPPQATDAAFYLGADSDGHTLLVTLYLYEDDRAEADVVPAPPRPDSTGRVGSGRQLPAVGLSGTAERQEAESAGSDDRAWGRIIVESADGRIVADALEQSGLDPFGSATLELAGYRDEIIELAAVGTLLRGGLEFSDPTFAVQLEAPFFYIEPWVNVMPLAQYEIDGPLREGLAQRREYAESFFGRFTHSRFVSVASLDYDLLSLVTTVDTFTGGAHPNIAFATTTYLLSPADGWISASGPCQAAEFLGWACDETSLRERIVNDLREQEAAWVQEGTVDQSTEWLLDLFALEPEGMLFLFQPYDVGPYAQGPFFVLVPYDQLEATSR